MTDVSVELQGMYDALSDISDLSRKQKSALTILQKTIIPFVSESSYQIDMSAKILAPISGTNYVHRRNEVNRKNDAAINIHDDTSTKKSLQLKRIEQANSNRTPLRLITNTVRDSTNKSPTSLRPVRKSQWKKISLPTITSSLPPPLDKMQYQPMEVISILSKIEEGSPIRFHIISHMIKENLIPIKKSGVYKMLANHQDGNIINNKWRQVGRKRLLDEDAINEVRLDLDKRSGFTIDASNILAKIQKTQQAFVIGQGRVPITKQDMNLSKTTLRNYQSVIGSKEGVSICTAVAPKTRTRYSSENSLISAMVLVLVVACTHYDISSDMCLNVGKNMLKSDVSDGVKMLYKMVCEAYGNDVPILPVRPELILSTDDTVQYIFEGKGELNNLFRLVSSKAILKAGTRSKYNNDDSKNMCGLRVKLTYTFTGAGTMAPIFISVLGLNDRELPQDQCVSVKIPGLCVGGGGVTVDNKGYDILMFMRGDKGIDKRRYQVYRDEVLLPFIRETRKYF